MEIAQPISAQLPGGGSSVTCDLFVAGRKFSAFYRTTTPLENVGVEPFVCLSLVPAMRAGEDITTASPVSAKIAARFPRITEQYAKWYPELKPTRLDAPTRMGDADHAGRGVGCFFSGGVDSFYSALRFHKEVDTLIFVHGFDVPLSQVELRAGISRNLRAAAAAMGKRLIEVETNVRELLDGFGNWGKQTHGSALISIAHLLSGVVRKVHIPSSGTRHAALGWGSHPVVDFLWSAEGLEVIHDDDVISRVDKTREVVKSDIALTHLRVCWENRDGAYNCGQCEKCLRTMMTLRLAGALDRCKTFDRPLDLAAVADLRSVVSISRRGFYKEILDLAERQGEQDIAHAIKQVLARPNPKQRWLAKKATGFRRRVLSWYRK
jgi:hypothetical protein